jgi:hypothetical protein
MLVLQENQQNGLLKDFIQATFPLRTNLGAMDSIFFMMNSFQYPEQARPMQDRPEFPPFHYFDDMEVIHWRNKWSDSNATAIAFKSGPPAGHHIASLYPLYPEWRAGLGHAHQDAGSFILFSKGVFLANDTGYTGDKETADHNSILVDGVGQHKGGRLWATWDGKPYEEYNKIRMTNTWLAPGVCAGVAVFQDAYDAPLQLKKMERRLMMVEGKWLVILDDLKSSLKHSYEWRLHTDREMSEIAQGSFAMNNGNARLVLQNLNAVKSFKIEPTIV